MSPTQRTLKLLRSRGYTVEVVERWNSFARVRQDLFGFADLLAIRGGETLAVQVTSGSNVSKRLQKIQSCPAATVWLACPARQLVVHGWAKRGPRGARKTWQCREVILLAPARARASRRTNPTPAAATPGTPLRTP